MDYTVINIGQIHDGWLAAMDLTYKVEFYVPSTCLLSGVADHVDFDIMSDVNATQTLAIQSLEGIAVLPMQEQFTITICDVNLKQQYL